MKRRKIPALRLNEVSDPFHLATDQAAHITELTDRIAALEAQLAEREMAIHLALENEEELDNKYCLTWRILNDALPPPPKETP